MACPKFPPEVALSSPGVPSWWLDGRISKMKDECAVVLSLRATSPIFSLLFLGIHRLGEIPTIGLDLGIAS